ncbi:MAG: DUF885 family protein, partial [Verrucomicrobia bacterium]|nr:DUF885 family protein [Verrucomicrobiota bacterium]
MQRNPQSGSSGLFCFVVILFLGFCGQALGDENAAFRQIAQDYIDQMPALSPVVATQIGDHRFDGELDDVSEASRQRTRVFYQGILDRMERIDRAALSRDLQVDAALLRHELRHHLWQMDTFQAWAWNPLVYTGKAGGSIYG